MPLQCPRCHTSLEMFTRHGGAESPAIAADMCLACGGLWLDGGEVALAYPQLAELQERRGDVLAAGDARSAIAACPRCEAPAVEVPFFDVKLDVCTACFGVWIDGDEMEALSRTMDRKDGLPKAAEVVGGYRTAAVGVMTKHVARCVECDKTVPFRSTHGTKRGAVCDACMQELTARALREGQVGVEGEEEEYQVPKESAAWQFVCDLGAAIGAILQMVPTCATCGCRRSSGCRC